MEIPLTIKKGVKYETKKVKKKTLKKKKTKVTFKINLVFFTIEWKSNGTNSLTPLPSCII